jgi:thioredoxin reductase
MAQLNERPFPPGSYPVVVVGTGPGGLQTSYSLRRLGVPHALLSADDAPAGLFRRLPIFQRLISWSKPYAPQERGTRPYERYDWNSLITDDPAHRTMVADFMDGTSYFPARAEMERALATFVGRTGLRARYGCRWESTRREDDGFTLLTTDGEYRCRIVVLAIGTTAPWKPDIEGLDLVPHYAETRPAPEYAGMRVFVVGKRNSAFELADGLLPWASQLILGSPRPAQLTVLTHTTTGARARYLQPYEDHVLGGGTFLLDAAIDRVERGPRGFHVHAKGTTHPGDFGFEVDRVIAATGFTTPLADLPDLGVMTFQQGRIPAQTPYWESASVPGVFFAGSATQGSVGIRKYGIGSNSAAVQGFRYNAVVQAAHIAERWFGAKIPKPRLQLDAVADLLAAEATAGPELWNQQSYLCRVLTFDPGTGILDQGIVPLAAFVDSSGPDGIALTVETDAEGDIHPAVYLRRSGRVQEHLLPGDPLLRFDTAEHRRQLQMLVEELV